VIGYLKRRVEPLGYIVPQGRDERRAQPTDNADGRIVRLERVIYEPVSAAERVRFLLELEC
jgi:hypothetical protein